MKPDEDNLSERLDTIEKLLKMLVVNSVLDDMIGTTQSGNTMGEGESAVSENFGKVLNPYGMYVSKFEKQNGYTLVYIEAGNSSKYNIKNFQTLVGRLKKSFPDRTPVFCFDSMNGMQRKRFVEEEISFCVKEKEIHICARK